MLVVISEYDTCNGYCLNGGTCYDHKEHGLRCLCSDDYAGTRCELERKFNAQ